jgi:hypothetical protein
VDDFLFLGRGIHYPIARPKLQAYASLGQADDELFVNRSDARLLSLPIGEHMTMDDVDVVVAATVALLAIGLLCGLWAWGEWCWFKLRRLYWFFRKFGKRSRANRAAQTIEMLQPVTKRMF